MLLNNYKKRLSDNDNLKPIPQSSVSGVNMLSKFLYAGGGPAQQSRMIKDKRRSLDRALLYSYQGAFVKKVLNDKSLEEEFKYNKVRALINPNKLKKDYDDKIISIGFEHNFKPGDVFEWCQTGTYWLIYLQDLTELAYFRGDIRKCCYEINWSDEDGLHHTYAAVRGPVETKIDYIQKHGISVDNPNYSLNILLPLNEENQKFFKRYSKFYLQGDNDKVCWRVEAVDPISTPGIIEINAVEYYANETEDDINNGVVGAKIEKLDPNDNIEDSDTITGETFIKPKKEYTFTCLKKIEGATWVYDEKLPIKIINISQNERNRDTITFKWTASYSGQFDLKYGDYVKTIVVESLF